MFANIFAAINQIVGAVYSNSTPDPGVPNWAEGRYSSLQEFSAFFKKQANSPSLTNLYSIHFTTPARFNQLPNWGFANQQRQTNLLLDYYCDTVNLPSKQVSTGQIVTQGASYKYPTGSAFSQINMTFKMPQNQYTRMLFERWIALMRNDADQYTDYYDDIVAPYVRIIKWERGGGNSVHRLNDHGAISQQDDNARVTPDNYRKHRVTACWELREVFPYNIGSVQLNNMESRVMTLTCGFYYSRYRFYGKNELDIQDGNVGTLVPTNPDRRTRLNLLEPDSRYISYG
jgi:hypothetical protein